MGMPQHEVVIVGAGFGGMGAAIQLRREGIDDILILDREQDLGGTWHVNRYPGIAVDIASVTYSFSFEPNPNWSRLFAPGAELKRYAEHIADKYDLRRHMRFGVSVQGARWDAEHRYWVVTPAEGEPITARYLIGATGYLSQPRNPDIEGLDSFAGTVIHTADWDGSYDPAGRRIAVIGTGATSVQLAPELARTAAELTVYQRTPIWVVPKIDAPIPPAVQTLFAKAPAAQRVMRVANTAMLQTLIAGMLHYRQFRFLNKTAAAIGRAHLRMQVSDPAVRRKLQPHYEFGCKRPTFSNLYFAMFNRPNVRLETTSIARIESDGVVTTDGNKIVVDTLVLATGFSLWETNFPAFEIIGRDGRDLGKWWRENRFQAYEGVTVPHFPNFLGLANPYSFNILSYFYTIEEQMGHLKHLFGQLKRRGAKVFEVTEAANARYLERMTELTGDSIIINPSCYTSNTYYLDPNGDPSLVRFGANGAILKKGRFPIGDYTYA
ncbi:flavin-containing monooxygenase [Nocardia huaxiensis]|uniref:NAD(P)/FAD-dependent oxidoreductase n=1 Tax=Nocardia huaxiensis TaxID=2755382 RepID=A0A7D6VI25_9NOCA|nr:NAD(P)/FAD-dependent oxidoreductase [Nocardia huaxiensis]QLY30476.1 NAD(P)/FAD-dependent oxidoreductase [Nocardia huaxiensis]UFS95925.1 NAD(P)/FAD-dependent oxidoreductase [Nocardia huaxiensis]